MEFECNSNKCMKQENRFHKILNWKFINLESDEALYLSYSSINRLTSLISESNTFFNLLFQMIRIK